MKHHAFSFVAALLLPLLTLSQTRMMTIEEATGMNRKLYPASLSQLQWAGDGARFVWVAKNCLVGTTVKTGKTDTLLRLETINGILAGEGDEPLKAFPVIKYLSPDTFYFTANGRILRFDAVKNTMVSLNSYAKDAENTDIDKASWKVAYTKENNLYISVGGKEVAVTQDADKGVVNGKTVHRNEFGIEKGTFWSPKGNYLAFYRMDESMVTEYPLVDISKRIAEAVPSRYPMAGMTSHKVTIGVFSPSSGTTTWLKTEGSADQYLTNITWSPDEKYIYVAVLNRDQNHMCLNQYEVANGLCMKTLLEETSEKYVEPLTGLYFLPGSSGRFIRESQQDGYNHLYLYNPDGTLVSQLTQGSWVVKEFVGFDPEGTRVFFMSNEPDPLDNQLYSCDLKTGKRTRLTRLPGTHRTLISPDARFIIDNLNNPVTPNRVDLINGKGDLVRTVLEAPDPLQDYSLGETTVFALKADDNSDLWCRLIKPAGFDPSKKYPVIIYVYGGPHSQMVTNSWLTGGLWLNYLAEQGFFVFTMDNRGTSNRGLAFEQAIFRNLGTPEVADQMKGVAYLRSLPWVDTARIGVNGWSYGGFLTMSMMLRHPGVFKVAVAGGPVIDWKYYEVMYGERYMDTPETNPEGYQAACILNYVKNLRGKVMIINGDQDGTVVPQNSHVFLKKCIDEGIQVDYFMYPGHEHNVRGKDRVHLNKKITDYFIEHL